MPWGAQQDVCEHRHRARALGDALGEAQSASELHSMARSRRARRTTVSTIVAADPGLLLAPPDVVRERLQLPLASHGAQVADRTSRLINGKKCEPSNLEVT